MFTRLVTQISDPSLRNELSFEYYLQMSYESMHSENLGQYITEAVKYKESHQDANLMFEGFIRDKLSDYSDYRIALDSIMMWEEMYSYDFMKPVFNELKLISLLRIAEYEIDRDRPEVCEKYLTSFEQLCHTPVEEQPLKWTIEMVYRKIAKYHYRNKPVARNMVERGLTFVPGSFTIRSALY
jgi:hypothetical protein